MTRRQFYATLRKIRSNFTWYLSTSGTIRGSTEDSCFFCPITAVGFSKTGQFKQDHYFHDFDNILGLSWEDSELIASASDNCNRNKKVKQVRTTLLNVLGLSDSSTN